MVYFFSGPQAEVSPEESRQRVFLRWQYFNYRQYFCNITPKSTAWVSMKLRSETKVRLCFLFSNFGLYDLDLCH